MPTLLPYSPTYRQDLLRLLLELQEGYFNEVTSPQLQELDREHNRPKTYSNYIDVIESGSGGPWQLYLAEAENNIVGFIIGRVEVDTDLVEPTIGQVEDWYVQPTHRGKGVGKMLYNKLENWFREMGCTQAQSETWSDNQLSIDAHKKAGYFVWAVRFKKKL